MTQVVSPNAVPVTRRAVDKFADRRNELAEAALPALGELGYARTTLREIAVRSGSSYGVLSYYFTDKIDLMTYCVRLYKDGCVRRYDLAVADATTPAELLEAFIRALVATLAEESPAQRLWYDLRLESLFEPSFRAEVAGIDGALRDLVWRIVGRYAELSGARPAVDPDAAYAVFDGMFFQLVMQQIAGVEGLEWVLAEEVRVLMPRLLGPAGH